MIKVGLSQTVYYINSDLVKCNDHYPSLETTDVQIVVNTCPAYTAVASLAYWQHWHCSCHLILNVEIILSPVDNVKTEVY
jgi:hypothetical protein